MSNSNNFINNQSKPKKDKKYKFTFWLLIILFAFWTLASFLGLFAFVENRKVKADEPILINQINTSHVGTYTSQNFTMQFSDGLYSFHKNSAMSPYTASFPLGTIDRVLPGNYLMVMSDLLPLQGVSILFLSEGANATIYEQISNTNNYTFSFPDYAIGTSSNVWLFISPDYDSTITNFSFTLSLFNANSAYSIDYLLGYQQGLFQYLSTIGKAGIFSNAVFSYSLNVNVFNPDSMSGWSNLYFDGNVPTQNINFSYGGFNFISDDFITVCGVSLDESYEPYSYQFGEIYIDFPNGVDISDSYLLGILSQSDLFVSLSSSSCSIAFTFEDNSSQLFSFNLNGDISLIDLSFQLNNSVEGHTLTRITLTCSFSGQNSQKLVGLSSNNLSARYYNAGLVAGSLSRSQSDFDLGFKQGKDAGYSLGLIDANSYTFINLLGAVVDAPLQALNGLLNFDFLGFNLKNFFYSLLTIGIVVFVIKTFL